MRTAVANQKSGGGVSSNGTRQAPRSNACPRCQSSLTVETDGNGRLRDVCTNTSCARKFARDPGEGASASRVAQKCGVEGCPGTLDANGGCACCAKRDAWMRANTPKKECQICTGDITGGRRGSKYCHACKPFAQKVNVAKAHNSKKKG